MHKLDMIIAAILICSTARMAWVRYLELRAENPGAWSTLFTPAHYVVHITAYILGYGYPIRKLEIPLVIWAVFIGASMWFNVPITQAVILSVLIGGISIIVLLTAVRYLQLKYNS
mgnify:CR=1 FL=1